MSIFVNIHETCRATRKPEEISQMKQKSARAAEEFLQQGHSLKSVQERILTDTVMENGMVGRQMKALFWIYTLLVK